MKGDPTLEEWLAKQCEDPEFAEGWAEDLPRVDLAVNVHRLRTTAGLTELQLAEAAKLREPRIVEIERGDGNPSLLTLTRIAIALGVPVDRLVVPYDRMKGIPGRPAPQQKKDARWPGPAPARGRKGRSRKARPPA